MLTHLTAPTDNTYCMYCIVLYVHIETIRIVRIVLYCIVFYVHIETICIVRIVLYCIVLYVHIQTIRIVRGLFTAVIILQLHSPIVQYCTIIL